MGSCVVKACRNTNNTRNIGGNMWVVAGHSLIVIVSSQWLQPGSEVAQAHRLTRPRVFHTKRKTPANQPQSVQWSSRIVVSTGRTTYFCVFLPLQLEYNDVQPSMFEIMKLSFWCNVGLRRISYTPSIMPQNAISLNSHLLSLRCSIVKLWGFSISLFVDGFMAALIGWPSPNTATNKQTQS